MTPPQEALALTKFHYDVTRVRQDFPTLQQTVHGKPLVYLDTGASAQTPQVVIDRLSEFYTHEYANIHRGVYQLSAQATMAFEGARKKVQAFLNAASAKEIVFVRGATEGINLVAHSWGGSQLQAGDEIIITAMEHHANIVPWQLLCERVGAVLKILPINERGELLVEELEHLITERTRLLSFVHVSNALGTINPAEELIAVARKHGIVTLIDACQSVMHMPIDVQALDCDFLVFSGHKLYGPTGIGVLYGRSALLKEMPPYQGGGDMIEEVSFEKTTFKPSPYRFEAGTPHIAGAIGLATAIDYVQQLGFEGIGAHEAELLAYGTELLEQIPGLRIIGTAEHKAAILSFVLDGVHPHDIGTILDQEGVAIRAGHHCAQPLMNFFQVPATARASLGCYNTMSDLEALAAALRKAQELFA